MSEINDCQVLPDDTWCKLRQGFLKFRLSTDFLKFIYSSIFRNCVAANMCHVLQVDGQMNGKAVMGSFSSYWIKSVSFLLLWLYLYTNKACLKPPGACYHHSRNVFSLYKKKRGIQVICRLMQCLFCFCVWAAIWKKFLPVKGNKMCKSMQNVVPRSVSHLVRPQGWVC